MQSFPGHSESSTSPESIVEHSPQERIAPYEPQVYVDIFHNLPLATRINLRSGEFVDAVRYVRRFLAHLVKDSGDELSDSEVVEGDETPRQTAFKKYWSKKSSRPSKESSPSLSASSENEVTDSFASREASIPEEDRVYEEDTSLAPPNLPPQDLVLWATEEENEYTEYMVKHGRELPEDVFQEFLASEEPFPALNRYLPPATTQRTTWATETMAMTTPTAGRQLWTEDMGDGSTLAPAKASTGTFNVADYAHFPLYTYEMVAEDDLHNPEWLPPKNCCLDDRLVFVVTLLEDERTRHERHPADFSTDGDVRTTRSPHGLPPKVVEEDGKVWYLVWKRQVVLRGDERTPADNKVRGDTATSLRKKSRGDPAPWSFGTESSTQPQRSGIELLCWMNVDGLDRQHWERPAAMGYVFWERMEQDKMWPFALPKYIAAGPPAPAQVPSSARDLRSASTKAVDQPQTSSPKLRRKVGAAPVGGAAPSSSTLKHPLFTSQRGRALLPSSATNRRAALEGTATSPIRTKHYSDPSDQPSAKRQELSSPNDKSSPTVRRTSGTAPVASSAAGPQPTTIEQAAGKIALLPVRKGLGDQTAANERVDSLRELRRRSQARIERLRNELRREEAEHIFIDGLVQDAKRERQPLHRMAVISQQAAEVLRPFDDALASSVLRKVDTEVDTGREALPERDPTPGVFRVLGQSEEEEPAFEEEVVEPTAPPDPYGDL